MSWHQRRASRGGKTHEDQDAAYTDSSNATGTRPHFLMP